MRTHIYFHIFTLIFYHHCHPHGKIFIVNAQPETLLALQHYAFYHDLVQVSQPVVVANISSFPLLQRREGSIPPLSQYILLYHTAEKTEGLRKSALFQAIVCVSFNLPSRRLFKPWSEYVIVCR